MSKPTTRSPARAAARLAAVQALYQHEMEGTAMPALLHEFHHHRLGATIEDVEYADADIDFFDDVVTGAHARGGEIDALIEGKLATGWTLARLDKPMKAILRAAPCELLARKDVPVGVVITEYLDVAHAFYDRRETGFVNGLLDGIAKGVRGVNRLHYPERPGSAQEIADELLTASEPKRTAARIRRRQNVADLRLSSRRTQGKVRLADAFAKLSGGSLLTATVLLIVNGQISWPIIGTALVTLLVFLASTMFLISLDREMADYDHAVDVIEAALKETER